MKKVLLITIALAIFIKCKPEKQARHAATANISSGGSPLF